MNWGSGGHCAVVAPDSGGSRIGKIPMQAWKSIGPIVVGVLLVWASPGFAQRDNLTSCISTQGGAAGGFTYLVNGCDVALYVSFCSVGDPADRIACDKTRSSRTINGQQVYGSTEVLRPRGRTPVAIRSGLKVVWFACDQKSGLAHLTGPGSPQNPRGEPGLPVRCAIPDF